MTWTPDPPWRPPLTDEELEAVSRLTPSVLRFADALRRSPESMRQLGMVLNGFAIMCDVHGLIPSADDPELEE